MTLNNWLCKHFDTEKRGYVTIANVFTFTLSLIIKPILYLFYGGLIIIFIGLISAETSEIPELKLEPTLKNTILVALLGFYQFFLKIIVPLLITIVILYILYNLSKIKIAKCELMGNMK